MVYIKSWTCLCAFSKIQVDARTIPAESNTLRNYNPTDPKTCLTNSKSRSSQVQRFVVHLCRADRVCQVSWNQQAKRWEALFPVSRTLLAELWAPLAKVGGSLLGQANTDGSVGVGDGVGALGKGVGDTVSGESSWAAQILVVAELFGRRDGGHWQHDESCW